MKIPPDYSRPIGQPASPDPVQRPAELTASTEPGVKPAAVVRPGASWSKAALDDPAAAGRMFNEALGQIMDASPAASQLRPAQRQQLERMLAADPVMRELVTRSVERALK
mgnify:CR=1 FL=1